jgi:PAS domain S-box-containing protein
MSQGDAAALCFAYEDLGLGSFWTTDGEGRLTYMSSAAQALLGGGEDGLIGRPFLELFLPPDREAEGDSQRALSFALARRGRFERVIARSEAGGRGCWWSISGEPQSDGNTFTGFRGHCADITGERRSAEESSRLAMHDPLTGLLNRRRMTQVLERTLTAYALQRRSCAIMLIDLDRFKQVNDTLGHAAGDALLKQVADRLVKIVGDKERSAAWAATSSRSSCPIRKIAACWATWPPRSSAASRSRIRSKAAVAPSARRWAWRSRRSTGRPARLVRNADLALYAAKGSGAAAASNDLLKAAEDRGWRRPHRRAAERPARTALPADRESHVEPDRRDGGAGALESSRAGLDFARAVHPDRRGIAPDLPHRRMGAAQGV